MTGRGVFWVVVVAAGVSVEEPRAHAHCQRCGERLVTEFPMKVSTFVEVSKGFVRAHRGCKEKQPNVRSAVRSTATADATGVP